jgi:hypothetical protein
MIPARNDNRRSKSKIYETNEKKYKNKDKINMGIIVIAT